MSNLLVQNIKHTNGTTSMVVDSSGHVATDTIKGNTTAASINVVGEGGSNTTNLQQGLTKAWIEFDNTGTVAINDSFNYSGVTDDGTGQMAVAFTTNMGNATYSIQTHDTMYGLGWSDTDGTGGYDTRRTNQSWAYLDVAEVWSNVHGDLA
tara:strand:+ start:105 stop:557 length:453 start_codon:yes stop_codon:yes gene_type:complete